MTTMRDYLLANKENDGCREEMDALLEFLATEPAICPIA
jgi:hypothetical protein